jgi:hypothetical protein
MDIKQEAIKLFNETWDLIDIAERSDEQKALMLTKAHASAHLWSLVGEPVNDARGTWQISHVYSVLGYGQPALLFGLRSLDICLKNAVGGLDLAFAYEAAARACAVSGDAEKREEYRALGIAASENLDKEDKDYVLGELQSL